MMFPLLGGRSITFASEGLHPEDWAGGPSITIFIQSIWIGLNGIGRLMSDAQVMVRIAPILVES